MTIKYKFKIKNKNLQIKMRKMIKMIKTIKMKITKNKLLLMKIN